jgi:hypothetical protein
MVSKFQKPFCLSSNVKDTIYGLTNNGLIENEERLLPYDEYFNRVLELAYYRTIAKIALNIINKDEHEFLYSLINLDNITYPDKNEITNLKFSNKTFTEIKSLIDKYDKDIREIINSSLENKDLDIANEFAKSIRYIINIVHHKNKKEELNIAVDL